MTVLFYIHALSGGGAERVWCLLASELARRGHRVVMAVDAEASENLPYLSPEVRLVVLGGSHVRCVLRLAALIRRERPDVAMSALSSANLKLAAAALLTTSLCRTVLSFHGYAQSEPRPLSQIGFALTPILSRLAARTVCVSDGLLAYLRTRWGASRRRTTRIYNPIALDRVERAGPVDDVRQRAPVILALGRLVPYKNFDQLLQAFATVTIPEARLVILGDGPERIALEAETARLDLSDRVEWRGYVDEPWAAFEHAKCVAVTSRSESFGLVVVEALAHGLPVVATDCDGPREILTDPSLGTLVAHDDLEALSHALTAALVDHGSEAPRRKRAQAFRVDTIADQYEALFHEIVEAKAKGRIICATPEGIRQAAYAVAVTALLAFATSNASMERPHPRAVLAAVMQKSSATVSAWFHG